MISSCKSADIIIPAVGKPNFITKEFINTTKRQILLDVGINRNENGKLCGDANSEIYDIDTLDYILCVWRHWFNDKSWVIEEY